MRPGKFWKLGKDAVLQPNGLLALILEGKEEAPAIWDLDVLSNVWAPPALGSKESSVTKDQVLDCVLLQAEAVPFSV